MSTRQSGKTALTIGSCPYDIYLDNVRQDASTRDLDRMLVSEYAGIEIYKGAATIPAEYNMTGSSCGVILMWTRERALERHSARRPRPPGHFLRLSAAPTKLPAARFPK